MVAFDLATKAAKALILSVLVSAHTLGATDGQVRRVPVKFRKLTADVAWNSTTRTGLMRTKMEIEVPEEGYPVFGLACSPTFVTWDDSALHPSMLEAVAGKPDLKYLKVKVPGKTIHQLGIEYSTPLEKVGAIPVSIKTMEFPFELRFNAPELPNHELLTNGLAIQGGEDAWTVRFRDSAPGFFLSLPDSPHSTLRRPLGKLIRWFLRLPYAIFGGGGDGPPPLIKFRRVSQSETDEIYPE